MDQHIEPLGGGLVTSRDPSLLAEGELQRADNCIYKPNDPALYRALGRSKLNATAISGGITGLKYCAFDAPDPDLLIAQSPTAYHKINVSNGDNASTTIRG